MKPLLPPYKRLTPNTIKLNCREARGIHAASMHCNQSGIESLRDLVSVRTVKRHKCRAPMRDKGRRKIETFPLDIHRTTMYIRPMMTKELVAASAEPLILSLLANGESYGYAIIQEIRTRSEEKMQWTDGMLYPVLHRMEARGLIKSRWAKTENGRKRKYYYLKDDGKRALDKHREQWSVVQSVLTGLRKEQHV